MDELLRNLLQGKAAGDTLGGARMALFLQMAQFAAHCKPEVKLVEALNTPLEDALMDIHRAGGVLVSVMSAGMHQYRVVCYMPQERKDGEPTVQH